jgi:hypothetical protein
VLGESAAQAWREGKRSGERCGETRGWGSHFIGGRGCSGWKCRWVTTGDLRPTPLMARGVLTGIQGGNQGGGVRVFDWRLNDGGREARGDQLRQGAVETCFGSAGARKGVDLMGGAHLAAT